MPRYTFRCNNCQEESYATYGFDVDTFALATPCDNPTCSGELQRVICSARFKRGLSDGYYSSVGGYARSKTDLQSQLSRKSDEVSERLGIDHNFKVADDPTPEFFGVTEEGLDSTARKKVESGQQQVKKFY
jgi:hypothetical protein